MESEQVQILSIAFSDSVVTIKEFASADYRRPGYYP
jgi:hypothetical protein